MAQAVLTSITRRSVVAGLALTGAPQGPKGEAVARYRHEGRRNVDRIVIAPDRGLRVVGSVRAVGRARALTRPSRAQRSSAFAQRPMPAR